MADDEREQLLQSFLAESEEHLRTLEESLVALEERPDSKDLLQTIFRAAHTLKGAAACLGFDEIKVLSHAAEDLLDQMREGAHPVTSAAINLLLQAVDALRRMVPEAAALRPATRDHAAALGRALRSHASLPAAAPAAPGPDLRPGDAPAPAHASRTIRVSVDKLERLLNLTSEIAIARGRLGSLLEADTLSSLAEIRDSHRDADRLYLDLQEQVMRMRMVPVGPTLRQHLRTVRDLAAAHHKEARLVIEGGDVEIDLAVLERIKDPITHLVRNAVDHGIESPQARRAAGKEPLGTVTLRASHRAGLVLLEVEDDGAGLDRERIARRARALHLLAEGEAADEATLQRFLFEPGFSTAERVTDTSGRGVGLDVVRRNIDSLRGSIRVASTPGRGTAITLGLPLTLAIIEGFSVGVGDEVYVIPLESVLECVDLPQDEDPSRDRGILNLRGEPLPFLRLRRFFHIDSPHRGRESVVVLRHDEGAVGLAVDALYGESQTVIKPLAKLFQGVPGVSGSALLGSGRVALILDVAQLFRAALAGAAEAAHSDPETPAPAAEPG